jgi:hypothetical protein
MPHHTGQLGFQGALTVEKLTPAGRARRKRNAILWWKVKNFFRQRWREVPLELWLLACRLAAATIPGANVPMHGRLYLKVTTAGGEVWDYGCAGVHLIVTAGKNYVAGAFSNTNEAENLKFHGFGTGTTAAAAGDTALQTEETTQYATDNTRPTGSQSVTTNVYTTVATYSPDSGGTRAITEWGLLSQAATGGGTLFDRQVFSAVNLVAGSDSLQATYALTVG